MINRAATSAGVKRGVFRTVLNEPAVFVTAARARARNRCVTSLTMKRSARTRGVINHAGKPVGMKRGVFRTVLNEPAVLVSAA